VSEKLRNQAPIDRCSKPQRNRNSERGFSMVELAVVGGLIMILAAMAMLQLPTLMRGAKADTAMRQVVDQMRQAREYAIAHRRYIQISFPVVGTQSEIQITQRNDLTPGAGAINPILSTTPIQTPMAYFVFGALADTPDGYGKTAAIEFGGASGGPAGGMLFQSDGALVDGGTVAAGTATPINGTVFLGVSGQTSTARAVTVLGSTGRVHGWTGISVTAWKQF
jgi:type II secretory pathway pseudopilin PulG